MVQLNVWTGTKWINIFDGNDFTNAQADLHRVAKVVEAHTSEIQDATKTASDAVKAVDSAVSVSKANSDAIAAQNKAISAVQETANSALDSAESAVANASSTAAMIRDADNRITANSTAIEENNKQIDLKANQQSVDMLNDKVSSNASQLTLLNNEIQSKVDSSTVNNLINNKGFITQQVAQSLIDQKADTITESITGLSQKVDNNNQATVDKIQQITASIDGVQSIVKDKADKSTVTQLANALQIKMTGSTIAQAKDVTLKYTGNDGEYPSVAPLIGLSDVEKGTQVELDFDYTASADVKFIPQFDGAPWIPWGGLINNGVNAKEGVKGHYSKVITVGDDSWQRGNAKNLCIRCDYLKGTIEITNLVLKYADTVHDVQSTFDMLRDDINLRVTKGDLLSQINIAAGHTLIQSNKIYLDADSVVFSNKAFIPSAAITSLSADKITSGTLDAGNVQIINLTADHIKGGTLDVGNMNIRNFSANDIEAGTLSGVTVKVGDNNSFFQTSGDSIIWKKGDSWSSSSVIGTSKYAEDTKNLGLIIADSDHVQISTWPGAYVENGKIIQQGGYIGHPRIMVEDGKLWNQDLGRYTDDEGEDANHGRILNWVSKAEYLSLTRTKGVFLRLDPDHYMAKSKFSIQKDNCVGAYFGEGDNGNEINFVAVGDGSGINFNAPLTVTNSLNVTGAKHSIVKTSQGYVGINAYETAEYYFGDIGESNTGDNGQVVIGIDKIFSETVNTTVPYQVFITSYSDCHVWVERRYDNRFVVRSDKSNAEFGWEIKAKRKGYENYRLRHIDGIKEKGEMKI